MKHLYLTILALLAITASFAQTPGPISGPSTLCVGTSITLTDAVGSGTWSTTSFVLAVGSSSGVVTGITTGAATITYSILAGGFAIKTVTVNAMPAPITGPTTICAGTTVTETDPTAGGVWISSPTAMGSIDPATGALTCFGSGVAIVSYTLGTGCYATSAITINPTPAPIAGPTDVCYGTSVTETDPTPGGTWNCTPPTLGTIGHTTGVLSTPITSTFPAEITIEYLLPDGCASTAFVSINVLPAPIAGTSGICTGSTVTETDDTIGGTWSCGSPLVATISSATGIVTGISAGAATITYSLAPGCAATYPITVVPPSTIYTVTGGGDFCIGGVGSSVGLSGSNTASIYQVYLGATAVGSAIVGSGGPINFGLFPAGGSYTVTATDITYGCTTTMSGSAVIVVDPLPTPYAVTGTGTYCSGGTGAVVGLSGSDAGVNYQVYSGTTAIASPVAGTGAAISLDSVPTVVGGTLFFGGSGTYTVVATNATTGCVNNMTGSAIITISPLPTAYSVTGGGSYCAGDAGVSVDLAASDPGVNYQLYNGLLAVGAPIPGTGSSISFGLMSAPGTYTVIGVDATTGCTNNMTDSATVTVNALPATFSVTGGGSYCAGGAGVSIGLSGSITGIDYQLYSGSAPTGISASGVSALPIDFGSITGAGVYTVIATDATTSCANVMTGSATVTITPVTTPSASISASPGMGICAGTTVTFTATATGGGPAPTYLWMVDGVPVSGSSSSTYSYVPTSGDAVTVLITSSLACAAPDTASSSVFPTVDSPSVVASSSSACGGLMTLTASGATSYSWSPTTGLSCPTCSSATLTPASTTTYTVTGTDATGCIGSATVTVSGNTISGSIIYSGGSSSDVFNVWLIQFNPSDSSITAQDSMTTCIAGGTPYYEFDGKPTGSYMAKAALIGSVAGASGYMPTYSLSTPHWDSAATISHTGSPDVMDITMVYGTVPSGPGFISGNVYSGAGKGTSTAAPGMLIYLKNTAGHIITYTYTDASGAYSFGSLANGSYVIYPEAYKYYTTYATVTLSPDNETVSGIDFKQHTTSGTITPIVTPSGNPVLTSSGGITVFPNPVVGTLNIQWTNQPTGSANITITDITGRVVYNANMDINTASGSSKIDVSGLQNGMYLIAIKYGNISYNDKIAVQN